MRRDTIIVKTLGAAAVIGLAYATLVQVYHPKFIKAPSADLTNRIFVENYVYGARTPTVLVGSSLTQRLPLDVLGPRLQSLAMSGDGALTGLAIAVKSPTAPSRILIEINKIDRGLNQDVVDQTFVQPLFTLRRHLRVLRTSARPMTYLYGLLRGRTGGQSAEAAPTLNNAQMRDLKRDTFSRAAILLPPQKLADNISALTKLVAAAQRRNIAVALYEMPIDSSHEDDARPAQIREAVRRALPPSRVCWLNIVLPGEAHTFDGEHLEAADSVAVAEQLRLGPPCRKG